MKAERQPGWNRSTIVVLDIRAYDERVSSSLRMTSAMIVVLDVLVEAASDEAVWGLRLCEMTGLGPGTVYPILERLAQRGWLETWWEPGQPAGRPRRRYYRLSGLGRVEYAQALAVRAARYGWRIRLGAEAPEGGTA